MNTENTGRPISGSFELNFKVTSSGGKYPSREFGFHSGGIPYNICKCGMLEINSYLYQQAHVKTEIYLLTGIWEESDALIDVQPIVEKHRLHYAYDGSGKEAGHIVVDEAAIFLGAITEYKCRACGKPLLMANYRVADGCPCNSIRGINHGIVPSEVCTCEICDPGRTGSSRMNK